MSDTDPYWVGAFAMSVAQARGCIQEGRPDAALKILTVILERFAESPVFDEHLRQELAPFWPEQGDVNDQDVLRSLRSGDPA